MPPSEQMDVLRVFNLEGHEQADGLEGVETLIDIVAQKNVLKGFHLAFVGVVEVLENAEELHMPAVEAAKDLDGGADPDERRLASQDLTGLMAQPVYLVLLQGEETIGIELGSVGGHQHHEHIVSQLAQTLVISTDPVFGLVVELFAFFHQAADWDFLKVQAALIPLGNHYLAAQSGVLGRVNDTTWSQVSLLQFTSVQRTFDP